MQKENNYNSRTVFLKKVSLAFISFLGLGLVGFNFQKLRMFSEKSFNKVSDKEANDIIRNMPSSKLKQLKPELPPNMQQTSDGL